MTAETMKAEPGKVAAEGIEKPLQIRGLKTRSVKG